jgi:hypothetical protein
MEGEQAHTLNWSRLVRLTIAGPTILHHRYLLRIQQLSVLGRRIGYISRRYTSLFSESGSTQ